MIESVAPTAIEPTAARTENLSTSDWLTPGRFAALLAVLIFAAFPQVLLGLKTFVVRDYGFFAYPLAHFQRESFWSGILPLWNPYNNCGVPFLAQWNTMPLYPPALIYLIFPLSWSLSFFCLLHIFIAGMGMYFLARRWTGCLLAAALAGVVFAFNGLSMNFLMWPSHIATWSWMPWVVLAAQNAWQKGGRAVVLAVMAGSLQMLAGGPETILVTWLFLVALWIVENVGRAHDQLSNQLQAPKRLPAAFRFFVVVVLVAGVTAIQVLPFLDLAAHSERGTGFADTRWSMPKWGWANFLVPMFYGHVSNMGVFFQYDQGWTSSYFAGAGSVTLAVVALCIARDRRVWLLAGVTGAALLMAPGDHSIFYHSVRALLPQISLITYPVKFVLPAIFCIPLLAAFAVAQLQRQWSASAQKQLTAVSVLLLVLMAAILVYAWRFPQPADDFNATLRNGVVRAAVLVMTAGAVIALINSKGKTRRNFLALSLVALSWMDLVTHAPSQNPTVLPWIYTPEMAREKLAMKPQPALGESRAMVSAPADSKFRRFISGDLADNFVVNRLGYFADCNLLDNVPTVNGFFSLNPGASGDLMSALYASTNTDFPPLMDFMAVSQITAPGQFCEWTNRATFQPLITAGQMPVFLDGTNALLSVFERGFEPKRYVVLPAEAKNWVIVTTNVGCRVKTTKFSAETVEFETDAGQPALVVLSQTYYHCWKAYIDGNATPLLRANYAFQAIQVSEGRHQVKLVYEDVAFRIGAIASGISITGCFMICVFGRKKGAEQSLE